MNKSKSIFENIILDKRLKATLDNIVQWEYFSGTFNDFFVKYTPESLLVYRGMGEGKIKKLKEILEDDKTNVKVSLVEQMNHYSEEYDKCYRKIRLIIREEVDGKKS